jgi:hypothetical protein
MVSQELQMVSPELNEMQRAWDAVGNRTFAAREVV